ncbi:hypothetical protein ABU162_21740 [Paenibacillus thiaminolyticus]
MRIYKLLSNRAGLRRSSRSRNRLLAQEFCIALPGRRRIGGIFRASAI